MRVEVDYISPCGLLSLFHCFPLLYLKDYMKKRRLGQSEQFSVLIFQVTDSEEQLYVGNYWTCLPLSAFLCQMQVDNFTNTELFLWKPWFWINQLSSLKVQPNNSSHIYVSGSVFKHQLICSGFLPAPETLTPHGSTGSGVFPETFHKSPFA